MLQPESLINLPTFCALRILQIFAVLQANYVVVVLSFYHLPFIRNQRTVDIEILHLFGIMRYIGTVCY